MAISPWRPKHLFPLPLPLRYVTVLCFAASASMHLVCGPWPPWSNKRLTDSKLGATGDNNPAHSKPIVWRHVTLNSRKSRNSFPGIEKKNRVLLTSLQLSLYCRLHSIDYVMLLQLVILRICRMACSALMVCCTMYHLGFCAERLADSEHSTACAAPSWCSNVAINVSTTWRWLWRTCAAIYLQWSERCGFCLYTCCTVALF